MANKKQGLVVFFCIIIFFAIAITLVIYIKNTKYENVNIRQQYTLLDSEKAKNIGKEFIEKYLNFSDETLKNGQWQEQMYKFIDKNNFEKNKGNELYARLNDKEWQLERIVDSNTINELISIDNVLISDNNHLLTVAVTAKENGGDGPDNAYYPMIHTVESKYLIELDNNYKIYFVHHEAKKIIKAGENYYNR